MQKLLIKGKKELVGNILISGSKNSTLPILAASLLAKNVNLRNIPMVADQEINLSATLVELCQIKS